MAKINLKQLTVAGKSAAGQVGGNLEKIAGAAGQGSFSVSAGPNGISINVNFNELIKKETTGNKIVSPVNALYSNPKVKNTIVFPRDLTNEHYIIFSVMNRDRKDRTKAPTTTAIRNIVLPVPNNLQASYGAQYENEGLGALGAAAAGRLTAAQLGQGVNDIGELISKKFAAASGAFKSGDSDGMLKTAAILAPIAATAAAAGGAGSVAGGLAALGTGGSVLSGIGVDEGLAINPHMAVLFKGVDFREHQFSYKFIARNSMESDIIQELIAVLKYHMHPGYTAGTLGFTYPDEFEVSFADSIASSLYKIGTCVLKSLTVNYNGEGFPLFFEDTGQPVSVEINMSFQETQIITRENLDTGYYTPKSAQPNGKS
jgi:hypothetical protein